MNEAQLRNIELIKKLGLEFKEIECDKSEIKLADDEYLFKFRGETAFLTKMNKNGTYPRGFDTWDGYWNPDLVPVIIKQKYVEGWKFEGFRMGKSTLWVEIKHPSGFVVEMNAMNYISDLANVGLIEKDGTIKGKRIFKNGNLLEKGEA